LAKSGKEIQGGVLRLVALTPTPATLLDHLGVLAAILDIPLLVSEEKTYALAKKFYPQVKTTLVETSDLTVPFLAANYDALFVSSRVWAIEKHPLFPLFCNKQMRIVYCPHGNSDKGHTLTKSLNAPEDISLVYGNHMLDLLKDTGRLDHTFRTIKTGNYRRLFFKEHSAFYQPLVEKALFSKLDRSKRTILYAPTWSNSENPSSFLTECKNLIAQIAPPFNLLIKLHPYLFERHPAEVTAIVERYQHHPQVLFLDEFPPIYPILEASDLYLGDFSSIGYDYLSFDRPMYFFNTSNDRGSFLHKTGLSVSTQKENVFAFIEKTLEQNRREFSKTRKEVYNYTFGRTLPFASLRKTISKALKEAPQSA
jgi:hypothetical protein